MRDDLEPHQTKRSCPQSSRNTRRWSRDADTVSTWYQNAAGRKEGEGGCIVCRVYVGLYTTGFFTRGQSMCIVIEIHEHTSLGFDIILDILKDKNMLNFIVDDIFKI